MNISQLENGCYIKAMLCGVEDKEKHSKKTGEIFKFYYLVVEESFTAQKKFFQLTKEALNKNLHIELNKLRGRTVLVPFYIIKNDNFLNYFYQGSAMPFVFSEVQKSVA